MTVESEIRSRPSARPLYIVSDVARFSRTSPEKASRLLRGYSRAGRSYQPFLRTPDIGAPTRHVFTFDGLIELSRGVALRRQAFSLRLMKEAYEVAQEQFGAYP